MQKQSNSFHTQKEIDIFPSNYSQKSPKFPINPNTTKENVHYIACNSHPSPVVDPQLLLVRRSRGRGGGCEGRAGGRGGGEAGGSSRRRTGRSRTSARAEGVGAKRVRSKGVGSEGVRTEWVGAEWVRAESTTGRTTGGSRAERRARRCSRGEPGGSSRGRCERRRARRCSTRGTSRWTTVRVFLFIITILTLFRLRNTLLDATDGPITMRVRVGVRRTVGTRVGSRQARWSRSRREVRRQARGSTDGGTRRLGEANRNARTRRSSRESRY